MCNLDNIIDRDSVERKNTGPLAFSVGLSCASGVSSRLDILAAPLSTQLRDRTSGLHQEIEALLRLPDSILTREQYSSWLRRFLGLYGPLEHSLARFVGWDNHGLALRSPSQSDCLAADLAVLGIDPAGVSRAPSRLLPHLPTFAHALGALYVLEGSTLGGKVILRDIEARIGPQIAGATQFFSGRGTTAGQTWQTFKAALDAFGRECPTLHAYVVSGAENVFRAIMTWFAPSSMKTGWRP